MQTNYKRKYLILGPWPRNRKLVRDVIKENTDLKVSPRKLRPVQLAHSGMEVAIGDSHMAFNNSEVSQERGDREVQDMLKYNIRIIYVSSMKQRRSHLLIESHIEGFEHLVALKLAEITFEQDGVGMKDKIRTLLKEHWNDV